MPNCCNCSDAAEVGHRCFSRRGISNTNYSFSTLPTTAIQSSTVVGELVGQDFRFRPIVAGPGVTVTDSGDDLVISSQAAVSNSLQGAYDISGNLVLTQPNPLVISGPGPVSFNNPDGISQGDGPIFNTQVGGAGPFTNGDTVLLWPPANNYPGNAVAHLQVRFVGYNIVPADIVSYVGVVNVRFDPSNPGDEIQSTIINLRDSSPVTFVITSAVANQVRFSLNTDPTYSYQFSWVIESFIVER